MTEVQAFLAAIETFIDERGWTATRFGREMANDPRFVFQLRQGREPRTAIRQRVMNRMREFAAAA